LVAVSVETILLIRQSIPMIRSLPIPLFSKLYSFSQEINDKVKRTLKLQKIIFFNSLYFKNYNLILINSQIPVFIQTV
jgi:hypothetical protein